MTGSQPPVDIRFEIRLAPTSEEQVRGAYDAIYRGEGIRHLESFYRWLLALLKPQAGRTLLDVACGEGVLPRMGRQLYGLEAYGSDLSLEALRIARRDMAGAMTAASGELLPFAGESFDYLTCIGSLEHFLDMRAGIREMSRVLKPGGTACILVPNTYSIIGNVYKALKTGMSTIDFQPLQRYAARGEWAMLLEEEGLQVVATIKYEREPPYTLADTLWYLRRPRSLIKLLLTPLIPLNLANSFVYLCRPARSAETG
ncbi:MAG: class I SAM-dependent methyltransferase [Ardenticatenaceae bacterium]